MSALEAGILIAVVAMPWCWLVQRELDKLRDPAYLRAHGVVIVKESVLQGHSGSIGEYMGHPIWASVRFMGMEYRFDRVLESRARERVSAGELFIEPGLVYVNSA